MLRHALLALALAPGLLPVPALAHSDMNGPHGGEVEDASPGPFHIETAAQGGTLSVFVTDQDGNPVPASGITGTAVVLVNKVKHQVALAPKAENELQGSGDYTAAAEMRVLVSLTIEGQKQQALFSPPVKP